MRLAAPRRTTWVQEMNVQELVAKLHDLRQEKNNELAARETIVTIDEDYGKMRMKTEQSEGQKELGALNRAKLLGVFLSYVPPKRL